MKPRRPRDESKASGELIEVCKVCTKRIRRGEDHLKIYHAGTYYTVCCASCVAKFEAAPAHYLMQT